MKNNKIKAAESTQEHWNMLRNCDTPKLFEFLSDNDTSTRKHIAKYEIQRRDKIWQFWLTIINAAITLLGVIVAVYKK